MKRLIRFLEMEKCMGILIVHIVGCEPYEKFRIGNLHQYLQHLVHHLY